MLQIRTLLIGVTLALLLQLTQAAASPETDCSSQRLALQVLGSGGPIADDARASSGYLLWMDGKAVALIDAGGGVFQRFGAAGANLDDLELIALTHLHTDHSADLPALLKGLVFAERRRALPVSGPTGAAAFPGIGDFLDRLFSSEHGIYAYLSGLQDGSDNLPRLKPLPVDHASQTWQPVFSNPVFSLQAVGVPHGPVPTLAYAITTADDTKIVISGDQNLGGDYFAKLVHGADLWVMPAAVPEQPETPALHARPSDIGKAAKQAGVGQLLLSHWMARSLQDQAGYLATVQQHYGGPVIAAEDLQCLPLAPRAGSRLKMPQPL